MPALASPTDEESFLLCFKIFLFEGQSYTQKEIFHLWFTLHNGHDSWN